MILTNLFDEACRLVPPGIRQALRKFSDAEEVRLRLGFPPSVIMHGNEYDISELHISEKHIMHVIEVATGASLNACSNFLSSGYIHYHGLRVGVCGQGIYKCGQMSGFKKYSSVSIRIPYQNQQMLPKELCENLLYLPANTLIAAAPGIGKTTALREIVRFISDRGVRVSLLDERGEFAGEWGSFDLGRCTDVLSFVPKAEAAMFMLRAMNPQLIAMDEITKSEDIQSIFNITGCGVNVYATVHGSSLQDMLRRPVYKKLISEAVFENLITISLENNERKYSLRRITT